MRIKTIKNQYRRDFTAEYVCEHCGDVHEGGGYDDSYFHNTVIPDMVCEKCGKKAGDDYLPLTTKYADGVQV